MDSTYKSHHYIAQITCEVCFVGSARSSWSCYFLPETSQECRDRAFELISNEEALGNGTITTKDNYNSKEIWAGRTPRQAISRVINSHCRGGTFMLIFTTLFPHTGYGVILGVICSQQQK